MHVIAKEEVEVEKLDARIAASEQKAEKEKSEIMQLQSDLNTGKSVFKYAGRSYTSGEVKQDLSRRFTDSKLPTPRWPAFATCETHVNETLTQPVRSLPR